MDRLKLSSFNSRGMGTLTFLLVISAILFIGQTFIFMDQQSVFKFLLESQNVEARNSLLASLEDLIADELALRNSRFTTNADFFQCLYANPSPCDETRTYDMILYSPNPPVMYGGGAWPAPPAGISVIAGGLVNNRIYYTRSAGICPHPSQTQATDACPLQAIIQFKPLCAGTISAPLAMAVPGICPGRATGFDILIGVGAIVRGSLRFKDDRTATGDARVYRVKSNSLLN